jgi:hypothetical protein
VAILRSFQLACPDFREERAGVVNRGDRPTATSARFAAPDANALLLVKSLLGHAAGHGTLGDLGAAASEPLNSTRADR